MLHCSECEAIKRSNWIVIHCYYIAEKPLQANSIGTWVCLLQIGLLEHAPTELWWISEPVVYIYGQSTTYMTVWLRVTNFVPQYVAPQYKRVLACAVPVSLQNQPTQPKLECQYSKGFCHVTWEPLNTTRKDVFVSRLVVARVHNVPLQSFRFH